MLAADQLEWRNLHLTAALAAKVDDLAPTEIIKRRIGAIDKAACHQRLDCFICGRKIAQSARTSPIDRTTVSSTRAMAASRVG
jgi:hypothetical protein